MKTTKAKKKNLRDQSTEKIRSEVVFNIRCLTGELISALQRIHTASRIGDPNLFDLRYVSAVRADLDDLAEGLRTAGEHFREVQSGIETLATRVKRSKVVEP